jgi:hypothetical protein
MALLKQVWAKQCQHDRIPSCSSNESASSFAPVKAAVRNALLTILPTAGLFCWQHAM